MEATNKQLKGLASLAYPVYFELLASVIAGIMGTFWVARLGSDAVAAVTVATNLENVLLAIILMVSAGTTVLISKHLGMNDLASVKRIIQGGWILWVIIGGVVAFCGLLFRSDIAGLFVDSGEMDTLNLTISYFVVSFPGILIFYGQNITDSIFKGNRNTKFPMKMALLSNVLILILDPLFIYGWLNFPRMGVQGTALATLLGRTLTLTVALSCLYRSDIIRKLKLVEYGSSIGKTIKEILKIGLPMSGDFMARMVSGMLLIGLIGSFGVNSLAAYGIGTKIIVFITMFFYAVRQAASIQISYNMGAGLKQGVARIGRQSLVLGCGAAAAAGLLMYFFAPLLIRIFTSSDQVVSEGVIYLHYMCLYLLPLACAVSLGGVFQGSGRSLVMFYVTIAGSAIMVLCAYSFSSIDALQVNGVWIAQIVSAALQAASLLYFFEKRNEPNRLFLKKQNVSG